MRWASESFSLSRISAARIIICARSANDNLRNAGNASAARWIFWSTCESVSASNLLMVCPVAGLIVAIAVIVAPQLEKNVILVRLVEEPSHPYDLSDVWH